MAKRRSSSRKSSKCSEPLNTLINLAGVVALGTIVKSQVKRDYVRGQLLHLPDELMENAEAG